MNDQPQPDVADAMVMTITPEMAVEMLETNTSNRPIRQPRVNTYAEAMRRGKWSLTGETIKISAPDADGKTRLIDGQHRLWACVESGTSFTTYVVYNVPDEAMTFIDSGLPRTVGDVINLSAAGIDYANQRGSVAKLVLGWDEGVLHNTNRWQAVAGRDRILDFIRENYEAQGEAIKTAQGIRRTSAGSITAIGAFVFKIRQVNPVKAEEFITAWRDGEMLDAESPVRALRQWLLSRQMNSKRTENPLFLLVMVKAWNAFLVNGSIRKMIVRKDETLPELLTGVTQ